MKSSGTPRRPWRTLLAAAVLALCPALAAAQTGTVRGTVSAPDGDAVRAAQVTVAGTRLLTSTNALGQFTLTGVPAGTHQLRVSRAGFTAGTQEITVRAGEETLVAVSLAESPVELDAMVVSASRRAERQSEAPATVTRIGPQVLENVAGSSFVGALKQANGVDFVQVGMTSVAINARGFNSSFNNRMLMMEDGRIAVLPENGLPVGAFTPIPKVDLAGIEVIVGPGSALYGADASNGVLTLQSKDPREYPGTTFEVTGGSRQYADVQFRHAGVRGGFGYKLSGEYNRFDDWENRIRATAAVTSPWEVSVGDTSGLDWESDVVRGYGALVWYRGDAQLELNGGWSKSNGVGQTNVGRNQLVDWTYNVAQARFTSPNWYASVYRTESDAGESYAANRYTAFRAASPATVSDEQVRQMSDWPSNGQLYAAELQNNFRIRPLLNTHLTWGAQYRHDVVSSDRQWLTDRLTGEDLQIDQWGVYAQSETPVLPWARLLLAGRYDDHEKYDAQFSPKAGVLVTPVAGHTFRVTYNRAFKSPTTLQTDFFIPDFLPGFGVFGNTDGFEVRRTSDNQVIGVYDPLVPEENQTWELGYKGLVNGRLFFDVAAFTSRYENFLSPLLTINVPALGQLAYRNGQVVQNEAGVNQAVLTYFNLGNARLNGVDGRVDYVLSPRVNFSATASWQDLKSIEEIDIRTVTGAPDTARIREASSLNAPDWKFTLGANFQDVGNFRGGLTLRHVAEYFFASGINKGNIPRFTTVDLTLGYRPPVLRGASLNLSVANLFTCHGDDQLVEGDDSECGFGTKHREMINMPTLGTMVFLGVRYDIR